MKKAIKKTKNDQPLAEIIGNKYKKNRHRK
jgi:hypothetical protein